MNSQISSLNQAYESLFMIAIILLSIFICFCLIRAIIGPTIADRLVAVNMMGTMVITIIAILAIKMNQGYLVDISIIYAMISFLAVIIISKVYMGVYTEAKKKKEDRDEGNL